jgi:hypothetical protein
MANNFHSGGAKAELEAELSIDTKELREKIGNSFLANIWYRLSLSGKRNNLRSKKTEDLKKLY